MGNLDIYNAVREVPQEALKPIYAGRLKGKSDINPMWRIKTLTEQFGPCGIGWKYKITDKRLEQGANGVVAAFVDIDLFVKADGQWSEAIPGTGGNTFVAKESSGLYTDDECFKKALTDAISVACKALGVGANVYWNTDSTKYDSVSSGQQKPASQMQESKALVAEMITEKQVQALYGIASTKGYGMERVNRMVYRKYKKKAEELSRQEYEELYNGFKGLDNAAS